MLDKLMQLETRYEELNQKLADPDVVSDQAKLREFSKEHRDLDKIVEAYRTYKKTVEEIEGNKELVEAGEDDELVAMAKEELSELEKKKKTLTDEIRILLLPKDPNDHKNIILEIRGGTGGDEAALFAGDLFRMYSRLAESHGWKIDILSASEGSVGGYKEIICMMSGDDVFSNMKYESGVHRVQRVPNTETQGRIHTSAVTVAVLPEAEEVDLNIADNELRFDVYRSSGPGGQSVNTTDSAVRVTHLPTGLVVTCQDEKSQHKNKAKALKILSSRLLDKMQAEQHEAQAAERKNMVKSGDRSEKIRTYNFPQDRVTDHRIGLTVHNLSGILEGKVSDVIVSLRTHYQAEALKAGMA